MRVLPHSPEAYQLLHDGAIALAQVEANGLRVDVEYLDRTITSTKKKISRLQKEIKNSEVAKEWKKVYRGRMNLGSTHQLGKVLFESMGFECPEYTATGKYSTSEKTLSTIDHPFVKDYLEIKKLQKAVGTYLESWRKEARGGLMHPFFNLHFARTYRSSSDSPNFQNIPNRNKEIKQLVRRAIIAREGHRLVEIDYSGAEVCTGCAYHHDPTMIKYQTDSSTDMHRDMAMEIFMLRASQVTPAVRHAAKNKFVFPSFYGSWYPDCSRNLWLAIAVDNLTTVKGKPLKEHLAQKGIHERGDCIPGQRPQPGTFEEHIQKVEGRFWNKRFAVYNRWKKDWHADYLKKGWFQTKTGFICQGAMSKNDVINYPVQGSAFHCLLWSLIRLQRAIERRGMKAKIIGQIHDSIVADVPDNEIEAFLRLARKIMTQRLPQVWDWLVVPFEIEAEVTPVGGSWVDKQEWKISA